LAQLKWIYNKHETCEIGVIHTWSLHGHPHRYATNQRLVGSLQPDSGRITKPKDLENLEQLARRLCGMAGGAITQAALCHGFQPRDLQHARGVYAQTVGALNEGEPPRAGGMVGKSIRSQRTQRIGSLA
jgi:hypothetical protein